MVKFIIKHPYGECREYCPLGYFWNTKTNICEECHASCEYCTGGTEKDCKRPCEKGLFFHEGRCKPDCPNRYF